MSAQQMIAGSDLYSTMCLYMAAAQGYEQQQARQPADTQEDRIRKQWESIAALEQMQDAHWKMVTQEHQQEQFKEQQIHNARIPG